MKKIRASFCLLQIAPLALVLLSTASVAQNQRGGNNEPTMLPEVEVRGQRGSLEDRFNSPGSRVIVTKEDIDNMGADTVTDVLRQLPGVTTTTGASGNTEIRMRGMDRGSTQILVDGERQNNSRRGGGMPIDQIPSELIERIEVIRAPLAEFSGASGGTINIVLKQAVTKKETSLRIANQHTLGENGFSFFFGRTGPLYDPPEDNNTRPINERIIPPSYFFGGSAFERIGGNNRTADVATSYTGGPLLGRIDSESRYESYRNKTREVLIFPRVNIRLGPKDTLLLNLFAQNGETAGYSDTRTSATGTNLQPIPYTAQSTEATDSQRALGRLSTTWNHRFTSSRLETRATYEKGNEQTERTGLTTSSRPGFVLGNVLGTFNSSDDRNEKSVLLNSKLTGTEESHIWTFGGELEKRNFRADTSNLVTGLNQVYVSKQTRLSGYGQDEWTVFTSGTLTGGLRVERLERETDNTSGVFSDKWTRYQPNLNLRLPLEKDTIFRAGLSGLNKIPALSDVIDRVVPSTGSNSSTRPDSVGNPLLKAERTFSLDTGIDHRNAAGAQMGLNFFLRHSIDPVIRPTVFDNGRWIQKPINGVAADAWGIEADIRTSLKAIGLDGWQMNTNTSYLASKVDLGNNSKGRIPGQPHYSANINVNKPFPRGGGWLGGFTLNLTGASDLGDTATSSGRTRSVARLDARVGYLFQNLGILQLGINNLTNQSRERVRFDNDGTAQRIETIADNNGRQIFISFVSRF
jgi:outer membrane receptor for ferrienterochelin and colicins